MYKGKYDSLILEQLELFYTKNSEFLIKENFVPSDLKRDTLLYSSNKSIRGKVLIFLDEIHFELKHSSRIIPYTQWTRNHNIESISTKKITDKIKIGEFSFPSNDEGMELFKQLIEFSVNTISLIEDLKIKEEELKNIEQNRIEEDEREKEKERILKLNNLQSSIISQLDKNNDGEIDLIEGESFNKLLNKNQNQIIQVDKNYIQKFVKISMYLKTKKFNIQSIFKSISDTSNDSELNELVNLLKNQIHTYDLLVFHSISMITSLVKSDLITFYEIYECFDQLGVFNSNWENEVSNKLTNIGDGIKDLMYSINEMENNIVNSIDNLTYTTQDSFRELSSSIESELSSINSSIGLNNLLTGIQTYQMYKINQNTKRIG